MFSVPTEKSDFKGQVHHKNENTVIISSSLRAGGKSFLEHHSETASQHSAKELK